MGGVEAMTTDNRTNEPTAEQILVDEWIRQADSAKSMTGMDAIWFPDAEETLAVLRANGLLSEGTPSEAQVERAARALFEDPHMSADYTWAELVEDDPTRAEIWRIDARRTLTAAAGVAPQEPSQTETKSGNNFASLDPEKVAAIIWDLVDVSPERQDLLARALCEAHTEGKLT